MWIVLPTSNMSPCSWATLEIWVRTPHALDRGSTAQPIGRFCRGDKLNPWSSREVFTSVSCKTRIQRPRTASSRRPVPGKCMGAGDFGPPAAGSVVSAWRAETSSSCARPPATPPNRFTNNGDDRLMTTLELHVTLLIIHRRNRCTKYLLA